MGLLQKAVETYDSHVSFALSPREGMTMIAPVSHAIVNAMFEITIDEDGNFCDAIKVDKKSMRTVIPVTIASAGRTSNDCPHPLCDQLSYIAPINEKRHRMYMDQLSAWANSEHSNPKVRAVLSYVKKETVVDDLSRGQLLQFNKNGTLKDENGLIRWRVLGDGIDACWLDPQLISTYIQYDELQKKLLPTVVDIITGERQGYLKVHPRGIVPKFKSAKIISSDDKVNFTFRGRFISPSEAATVGVDSSQKAHNALRWLVENQGVRAGERVFLCWNPQGRTIPHPTAPFCKDTKPIFKPSDYKDALYRTLLLRQSELDNDADVVVTAFDGTTENTGRLSVTYYNEFRGSDFLRRLHDWDNSCCWYTGYGENIESPRLKNIINAAFGRLITEKDRVIWDADDKLVRQWMQILVKCRIEKQMFPNSLFSALVSRASSPERFAGQDKDGSRRNQLLCITCAVIKKYRYDRFKEEWKMSLEPEKMERSYQFGRLLAVLEQIEKASYRRTEREHKTTYAIRNQHAFCNKPFTMAANIHKHLDAAYIPRLSIRDQTWYKNLIGQILEMISRFPEEDRNQKLSETYLLGYYLQRNAFHKKMDDHEKEEDE